MPLANSAPYRSTRRLVAITALAATAACGAADHALTAPSGSGTVAYGKPGQPQPVNLGMTVDDAGPSGVYRITSDGLGEYVNGQGMSAQIDGSGNLQIGPTVIGRHLTFDYNAPIDPLNTYRPHDAPQSGWKIKSNKTNNGNPVIQDLGSNGNPASGCYNVTIAHGTSDTLWQNDYNVAAYPQATYVYITRTNPGVSPAAWTMVSDGPCLFNANWANLSGIDNNARHASWVSFGYFDQRFSIHLREIP